MAAITPTAAAAAAAPTDTTTEAAPAAETSESAASQNTDLAAGIIVVIVLACLVFAFAIGLIWFCVRRRRTKKRRAQLLQNAQEQTQAEHARLSQSPGQWQGNGPYQLPGQVSEMPSYPTQSPVETDGVNRYEVSSLPPRANEMYSPPASADMFSGPPPSSELDGSYGSLPTGPVGDVSSPMLRREHEQIYSNSWKAAGARV